MYDLAAQLLEKIAADANGDPNKMQQMMLEAQQNPEEFYKKYFDENLKAQVRGIANKVEGRKAKLNSKSK